MQGLLIIIYIITLVLALIAFWFLIENKFYLTGNTISVTGEVTSVTGNIIGNNGINYDTCTTKTTCDIFGCTEPSQCRNQDIGPYCVNNTKVYKNSLICVECLNYNGKVIGCNPGETCNANGECVSSSTSNDLQCRGECTPINKCVDGKQAFICENTCTGNYDQIIKSCTPGSGGDGTCTETCEGKECGSVCDGTISCGSCGEGEACFSSVNLCELVANQAPGDDCKIKECYNANKSQYIVECKKQEWRFSRWRIVYKQEFRACPKGEMCIENYGYVRCEPSPEQEEEDESSCLKRTRTCIEETENPRDYKIKCGFPGLRTWEYKHCSEKKGKICSDGACIFKPEEPPIVCTKAVDGSENCEIISSDISSPPPGYQICDGNDKADPVLCKLDAECGESYYVPLITPDANYCKENINSCPSPKNQLCEAALVSVCCSGSSGCDSAKGVGICSNEGKCGVDPNYQITACINENGKEKGQFCCKTSETCTLKSGIKICQPKDNNSCDEENGETFCQGLGEYSARERCCNSGEICINKYQGKPIYPVCVVK